MNSAFVWDVEPAFNLFGVTIEWYRLLMITGWFMASFILTKLWFEGGKKSPSILTIMTYSLTGGITGARLAHCLFYNTHFYLTHPLEILKFWEGGLASHGGYLGVIAAIWIYAIQHEEVTWLWIVDRAAICSILCGSFIRIGNLFNSEILGRPTDLPWAIVFAKVDLIPRHPVQLYESIGYLSISLVLYGIYRYYEKKPLEGRLLGFAFIIAFSFRFLIEFIKENQSEITQGLPLNMGQLLSIPFIFAGIFLVLGIHHKLRWARTCPEDSIPGNVKSMKKGAKK
jgi:prolipoprotein diacylglyceryl transferase